MLRPFVKVCLILTLSCLWIGTVWAESKLANSSITRVTVYPDRAKVVREVTETLTEGDHSLKFVNIPIAADVSSFHASSNGTDNPLILGLSHQTMEHFESPEDSLDWIEQEIRDIEENRKLTVDYKIAILEERKKFLLAIGEHAGETMADEMKIGDVKSENWNNTYSFFATNLGRISDSLQMLRQKSLKLADTLDLLKRKMKSVGPPRRINQTRTVEIDIRLQSEGEITLALDYMIGGASWKPLYDARLQTDRERVQLDYFAEITQRTGEDWTDVELTISTSDPSKGSGPGELNAWYVAGLEPSWVTMDYRTNKAIPVRNVDELLQQTAGEVADREGGIIIRGGRAGEVTYIIDGSSIGDPLGGYGPVNLGVSYADAVIQSGGIAAIFVSARKETIISGGKAVRSPIGSWLLPAEVNLVCRPKLNSAVFRQVEITNQADAPLLPGVVNIFADSDFLGNTQLRETIVTGQEFKLPFGFDNEIAVNRKISSHKRTVKKDKITIARTVQISVKNWGESARNLTLEEAFPMSQDNRIKTKTNDIIPEPTEIDEQGKARWQMTLPPGGEKIISFSYEVVHPKGMNISGI